jgi:lipooligosaccharide transport system ATP-binding protein
MEIPVISANRVTKTYKGTAAVDDLSFAVPAARCFGLLGPNGAGKTTMVKILHGKVRRDRPQAGQISVFGYDPDRSELQIKFLAGIVPQEDNLDVELSVLQNLLIYARFYGLSRRRIMPRIERLLEFMELGEKKKARIRELSGGMKRRLLIVRALIHSPRLLILDEPTTGLDPQVRHVIWDRLRSLKKDGVTIILTTHYMDEAFQLCDSLIIMNNGQKVLEGKPAELVRESMESYVLEVTDPQWPRGMLLPEGVRREGSEGRVLLYSESAETLQELAARLQSGGHLVRQSNLEDVFLKFTGRKLR